MANKITAEEHFKNNDIFEFIRYENKTDKDNTRSFSSGENEYVIRCKINPEHEFKVRGNSPVVKNNKCRICAKEEKDVAKKEAKEAKKKIKEDEKKEEEISKEESQVDAMFETVEELPAFMQYEVKPLENIINLPINFMQEIDGVIFTNMSTEAIEMNEVEYDKDKELVYLKPNTYVTLKDGKILCNREESIMRLFGNAKLVTIRHKNEEENTVNFDLKRDTKDSIRIVLPELTNEYNEKWSIFSTVPMSSIYQDMEYALYKIAIMKLLVNYGLLKIDDISPDKRITDASMETKLKKLITKLNSETHNDRLGKFAKQYAPALLKLLTTKHDDKRSKLVKNLEKSWLIKEFLKNNNDNDNANAFKDELEEGWSNEMHVISDNLIKKFNKTVYDISTNKIRD